MKEIMHKKHMRLHTAEASTRLPGMTVVALLAHVLTWAVNSNEGQYEAQIVEYSIDSWYEQSKRERKFLKHWFRTLLGEILSRGNFPELRILA